MPPDIEEPHDTTTYTRCVNNCPFASCLGFFLTITCFYNTSTLSIKLGSKSARFARALTFLAPAECFYGYCTHSVTTIQIQHETRVDRSPDRPQSQTEVGESQTFQSNNLLLYQILLYCYFKQYEHLHSIVFTYYAVQLRMETLCLRCCLAKIVIVPQHFRL